jgi:hypothetical protein
MEEWEKREVEEKGDGRGFHVLKFPKDGECINMMHDWALSAEGEGEVGKEPPRWGEREFWTRERFPAIKKAFQGLGEGRHGVRTLGEVGFDFEAWRGEKEREDKGLL